MAWTTTDDLDEFVSAAGGFLRARPVPNTLLLTTADSLRARGRHTYGSGDPRFGWWRAAGGAVGGAFLHTPPHPALLTDLPDEAIESLVDALGAVPGFSGEIGLAQRVAAAWTRRTGGEASAGLGTRLYRLGELRSPDPVPAGRARVATTADRELLISWYEWFTSELGELAENLAEAVDDRIGFGGLTVWEADGVPVSMAGHTRPIAGMARVAPVFTPRELRRRGYAAGATAAVSRAAARLVDDVLLFTDAANATTNALYQRLGYVPIEDRVVVSLSPPQSAR